jgi:hypothetical protein
MNTALTRENAHATLLRDLLGERIAEDDALLWMVLLHTHEIHMRPDALAEAWPNGQVAVLPAETQRGVASIIASLWPDRDDPRAQYVYWYILFNTRTPYETLDAVPDELKRHLLQLRDSLAADPRVIAVVEEA